MEKIKLKNILFILLLIILISAPIVYAETNINYNNLCAEEGIKNTMRILGNVLLIIKIVVPLLIIIFGMIDFIKAITSDDEKAINKATESLIRRIISGLVIFFIPTIVWTIFTSLDLIDGSKEIEKTEFGACTKCLLKLDCD